MSSPLSRIRPMPSAHRNAMHASYDFLTGPAPPDTAASAAPAASANKYQSMAQSTAARVQDGADGDSRLRADLGKAQYDLVLLRQERELEAVRHEKDLAEAKTQAEEEWRLRQKMESERNAAVKQVEDLTKELEGDKEGASRKLQELERRAKQAEAGKVSADEEMREVGEEMEGKIREGERATRQLKAKFAALQTAAEELNADLASKVGELQRTQREVAQKEEQLASADDQVSQLKRSLEEAGDIDRIKREFSEQVKHVSKLEIDNRAMARKLSRLEDVRRSVELVEEEKRSLERKVDVMDQLRDQLSQVQLEYQGLESERAAWKSYLERVHGEAGAAEFDSPEDMARALSRERLETATLTERLGRTEPELRDRDERISKLQKELQEARAKRSTTGEEANGIDHQLRIRLERQRTLAIKESEYLRAHLKAFEAESVGNDDAGVSGRAEELTRRISQLESLIDDYRDETRKLTDKLVIQHEGPFKDSTAPLPSSISSPMKRKRLAADDDDNPTDTPAERYSDLTQKIRDQTATIASMASQLKLLEHDLSLARAHLSAAQSHSQHRTLQLRENPTLAYERVKAQTLAALRAENATLQQQLSASTRDHLLDGPRSDPDLVPRASLAVLELDLSACRAELATVQKRGTRLRQIFAAKSAEFREAVASLLGYKLDFLPNGRVRVTAMADLPKAVNEGDETLAELDGRKGAEGEEEAEGEARSIVFDGEKGTMRIGGGGRTGAFGREIRDQMRFWVEERSEVPCFLASLLLEGYDRGARAAEKER